MPLSPSCGKAPVDAHGSVVHGAHGSRNGPVTERVDRRTFLAVGGGIIAGLVVARRPFTWPVRKGTPTFRFLADDPRFVYSRPCFSPSGERVVYMRAPATDNPGVAVNANRSPWTLWTTPTEGGEHHLLFDHPKVIPTRPDWSTVSNRIAFTGMTDEGAELWLLDPDTGDAKGVPLPDAYGGSVFYPTWYPDGERIAVTDYSSHTLLEVWPDEAEARPLTDPSRVWVGMASVAPDPESSPRIAFAGQPPGKVYSPSNNQIWIRQPDGGLHRLDEANGRTPWWSPSGDRLAFSAVRAASHPSPVISPRTLRSATSRIYVRRVGRDNPAIGVARAVSPPDHTAIHAKWHPSENLLACTMRSLVSRRRGVALLEL